ncbi:MAG: SAM-dependent methyltransferase [Bacilli bacterium]|jgi:tRNA (adenine22-N1)-methyltransferase|nr:SAM-dependent methyltransferase [Bacilli bacterium]
MKQKRLDAICAFLDPNDCIIDIGCDHAYVPIEMAKRGAKKILATDIHEKALEIAKKNIQREHLEKKITCLVADGLKKVDVNGYDTLVIAGMGTNTIKKILNNPKKLQAIQKVIIQSNNDLKELRQFLSSLRFQLIDEIVLLEKNHYYTIMKWKKGTSKLSKTEEELGIWRQENLEYYQVLEAKFLEIKQKIPLFHIKKRFQIWRKKTKIKTYIKKSQKKNRGMIGLL